VQGPEQVRKRSSATIRRALRRLLGQYDILLITIRMGCQRHCDLFEKK
jgi:hypothetical protein